jgi:hypothetical protein
MTAKERANLWISYARLARDNARDRLRMASQWPDSHPEWRENDLRLAHAAYKRARDYLDWARMLRSF